MTFFPLPALNDNYIWITENSEQKKVWAVDPGDAAVVRQYCEDHERHLAGIIVTHHHWDHTDGVAALCQHFHCPVFGPENLAPSMVTNPLREGDTFTINGVELWVIATPGHTLDHLCYIGEPADTDPFLLCGDTLFRGGCGRLFEGTAAQMLSAMTRLRELPGNTKVYGTHEYTLANYRFAKAVDPDNSDLHESDRQAEQLRQQNQATLPSTIAVERQTNPFLRFDEPTVVLHAAQLLNETPAADMVSAFAQIRRAKDGF